MRVGEALKKVFEGKTLTVKKVEMPVQFHYGDQKELNLWISLKDKVRSQKYPLIWYVIANEEDAGNGKSKVDSKLILYNLIQTTLDLNLSTNLLNDGKKIPYKDEPNFGVNESNPSDFTSKTKQKEQSITTDIVDARILKLRMIINLKCINND